MSWLCGVCFNARAKEKIPIENLLIKIRQSYNAFNENDRRIGAYILEKKNEVLKLSIKDMARLSGTSQSAVVRFCKLMGLSGFKDFKYRLTTDVLEQSRGEAATQDMGMDITGEEPIEDIIHRVVNNSICSIMDTQRLLDQERLQEVIHRISQARRLDFYGVGASGLVALDACEKFIRIGKISNAWLDPHVQITMATNLTPDDVAIILSYSGMTSDMLDVARVVKDAGAYLVAITKYSPDNLLSQMADETLCVASPEITLRSGATSSRIAQLIMVDILFMGAVSLNTEQYRDAIRKSYRYANQRKKKNRLGQDARDH